MPLDVVGYEPPQFRTVGYVSEPAVPFSDRDLSDLLLSARRFNARHQVTGKLVVLEDDASVLRFAQVVEGPRESLALVLSRIKTDPRHRNIQVVLDEIVDGRRFADWEMAVERVDDPRFKQASEQLFA